MSDDDWNEVANVVGRMNASLYSLMVSMQEVERVLVHMSEKQMKDG